jgi:hypothetical protein
MSINNFQQLVTTALGAPTVYQQLNSLRDAFNALGTDFDLYLEDNWNDPVPGETHFEYRLRSLQTKDDIGPLGFDVYTNHQDANGVWHLGDYQRSYWCLDDGQIKKVDKSTLSYALMPVDRVLQFLNTHRDWVS